MLLRYAKPVVKSVPILRTILRPVYKSFTAKEPGDPCARRYCSLLPQLIPTPVFVKIGANDGTTGDPVSKILLADQRWKGLLIEPVPYIFKRLTENFSDSTRFSLEQAAIGKHSGEAPFYYVNPEAASHIPNLPYWHDQLGSFDRNHIIRQLSVLEPFIIEERVPVLTLDQVFCKHEIKDVHLLHIDTEGYDHEVLKAVNLEKQPPMAIYIEHLNLARSDKAEMLRRLRKAGYRVDDCGCDYFAIHRTSSLRNLVDNMAIPK